jgi:galactokinase
MIFHLNQQFIDRYGKQPMFYSAPGRVNLIGEHTDYNEGFVLPGAVDKNIYIAIAKNDDRKLKVYANQFNEQKEVSLDALKPVEGWFTYLAGMMFHLQKIGKPIGGVDMIIDGGVPVGAGMSSSAAICSVFGFAVNELYCLELDRMQLALIGQKTEHTFAGVKCGIMDQFASLHGKAGYVMKLDCRSLEYEYIPFHFPDYKIVLVNSMVSHALASSEYNLRRQQCEEGVRIMKQFLPGIKSLRDVSLQDLEAQQQELPKDVLEKCHYVISENERLLQGCGFLAKSDIQSFGKLMYASHEGLSKEYRVSCEELDFLVETARQQKGVAGARMMGGGFGGCTINLVKTENVDGFAVAMKAAYQKRFHKEPDVYITQIEDGAKRISSNQ